MVSKKVSIYVSAYNAEKTIEETLYSILNQTYKNISVVVVDDGSTDSTGKILKSINDSRLEIVTLKENLYMVNAFNEGLKRMDGDYIAHCDADDVWELDKIEKQVEFLENNKKYGACFTHVNFIDSNSKKNNDLFPIYVYNIDNMSQAELIKHLCNNSNHLCHSSFVSRREIVEAVGEYDLTMPMLQDYDYWLRLLTVAPIYIMQEPLVSIRIHSQNNSKMDEKKEISHNTEYLRAVKKCIDICPDDLFLEAFPDELLIKGEHTHDEVIIEKAFVLGKINTPLHSNKTLLINSLVKVMNDEKLRKIAKEKFGFSVKDFYEIQKTKQFYNPHENDKNADLVKSLENEKIELALEYDKKIQEITKKYNHELQTANDTIEQLNFMIFSFQNSFFWRLTKPFRMISQKLKNIISKNRTLLNICIIFKCFLRSGFSAAKSKYKTLHHYKMSSQKISNLQREKEEKTVFANNVKFSVLVPLYNTPKKFLIEMIESVQNQTYSNWELCIADGSTPDFDFVGEYCKKLSSKDKRVKYKKLAENKGISENTNACIDMSSGDYIALFDHDDILHPSALFEYAKVINEKNADFIYCDEDKFEKLNGKFFEPHFKPDFALDNLRANNYICHFTVFKKSLLDKAGKFRKEFDGSQDHDLILRLTEIAQNIVHIPKILYRWRVSSASVASDPYAKPYTIKAGINAVTEHLERLGIKGTVESSPYHPNIYRIKYEITGNPLVSIMIPNYNHIDELDRCIKSILNKSTYKNYEIIIIENNSDEKTFAYYESLKQYDNIRVVVYDSSESGFNYSAINNFGFKHIKGEHIILLNNDVEIISPNWIEEMLMFSQREDVGAVGAKLYYPNDTIQHAGIVLGILTLAGHSFKHFPKEDAGYFGRAIYQQNVTAVTAACLMMKSSVFREIDGLDETFKVAFNDVDMCMRIRKAGYNIVFTPYAELYHYESLSRGMEDTPAKKKRFESEVQRFQKRWKKELKAGDPYYNPNLTTDREDFSLK